MTNRGRLLASNTKNRKAICRKKQWNDFEITEQQLRALDDSKNSIFNLILFPSCQRDFVIKIKALEFSFLGLALLCFSTSPQTLEIVLQEQLFLRGSRPNLFL